MLWHSDARDIIECHRTLLQVFNSASKSRRAKHANESFSLIATIVVCLEVLARDFAGWGKRHPAAKSKAEAMYVDFPPRERGWFMDKYLYSSLNTHRELASALIPSAAERSILRN
jgi:hypothetical protein